ncbi:MAG: phosphonopyruvate decarboxylase [Gammaproteobacteria bacterium]
MKATEFVTLLGSCGIQFATGVPDSLQQDFCNVIALPNSIIKHIAAPNEGVAIGLAIGFNISSETVPLVYMQNSGLGNALNPLISLAHSGVYNIPIVLMIGWRGEPGSIDEPQHLTQGMITRELLELLQIPYLIINQNSELPTVGIFIKSNLEKSMGPIAILVSANTFDMAPKEELAKDLLAMTREQAVEIVTQTSPKNSIFVSTTGKLSRELNEIRKNNEESGRDFMTVGGMGHASSIALGVALNSKDKIIICLDGDGAALMHLGSMAMIGEIGPSNFVHVVFNNGVHESVGGQPIAANLQSFVDLAYSLNYKTSVSISSEIELTRYFKDVNKVQMPCLVEVRINTKSRNDLTRPSQTPTENKEEFIRFLNRIID